MLKNSIAFDIQASSNVLDGCYADIAEIGFNIGAETRIINCNFFNNPLMGLKKSTAINHTDGKRYVSMCDFFAPVGTELLYVEKKKMLNGIKILLQDLKKIYLNIKTELPAKGLA